MISKLTWIAVLTASGVLSCTIKSHTDSPPALTVQTPPASPEAPVHEPLDSLARTLPAPQPSSDALPVERDDPVWGSATAPVTLIEFSDLECPFCLRAQSTIEALKRRYGPAQLRFVWKHNPLSFHARALEAALFAQAVWLTNGPDAFFRFVELALTEQKQLEAEDLADKAARLGLDARRVAQFQGAPAVKDKIDRDILLARTLGATGTPSFFVNGRKIAGAQPLESFVKEIDAELAKAAELTRAGTPPEAVFAARVAENLKPSPAESAASQPAEPDLTVWKVPVAGAPSQGPKDALVTIVAFFDYQCPFTKRVQDTLRELREQFPKDVRLVVRQNPLSFHARANAAAALALEARAQRGDAGFFEASRRLFAGAPALDDEHLLKIAAEMKLNEARVQRALGKGSHQKAIDADAELASSFEARGTPHFFINGVRLSGAQPLEAFVAAVSRELAKAEAVFKSGVPRARVYAELTKDGKEPPAPERKELPAPSADNPSRGPEKAPLVVRVFSDFQCPFCKRVLPTLEELEQRFPGKVRWVFHNYPLPFHPRARAAATAALEARAQKGDTAFWKMHDRLFDAQAQSDGLSDDGLVAIAASLGLDVARFEAALADGRHDAAIAADLDLANGAGIGGTPAFVINGYYLSGAQPITSFARVAHYALAHPSPKAAPGARPSR
jgi:protein-disulfide isomerase